MSGSVISYPIPAYQNLPIRAEFYTPMRFIITAIANGKTTTVTTAVQQDFAVGQLVRFIIPTDCGIRELNEVSGYLITIVSPTQFIIDVDSSFMSSFVAPVGRDQPQILPIGDINSGAINTSRNMTPYILGSFRNIS